MRCFNCCISRCSGVNAWAFGSGLPASSAKYCWRQRFCNGQVNLDNKKPAKPYDLRVYKLYQTSLNLLMEAAAGIEPA